MWRGTDGQTDRRTAIATENSKINICSRFDKVTRVWRCGWGTDGQTDRQTAIATENSKINICNRFDKVTRVRRCGGGWGEKNTLLSDSDVLT